MTSRATAPLRYDGIGEEIVHALKYRGYAKVVERLATPLMLGVLDRDGRLTPSCPCRCTAHGSCAAGSTRRSFSRGA